MFVPLDLITHLNFCVQSFGPYVWWNKPELKFYNAILGDPKIFIDLLSRPVY